MEKGCILAHRGLWREPSEKNSKLALFKALENGFGIETDIRYDKDIGLVISHDILNSSFNYLPFEELLIEYKKQKINSKLAINIKSDGLHKVLKEILENYSINQYFIFDMSIPDLISGVKYKLNQYARYSDYEDPYPYSEFTNGVWIDKFNSTIPNKSEITFLYRKWSSLVFVSPELHGREHLNYWEFIKIFLKKSKENIMICTDFPSEAYEFFKN
tara:strand:- start:2480 stop:3127 length:648 start_codon:yes stop_codon:yes gene_type:complete